MSLINDALKKAQRERTGASPQPHTTATASGAAGAARPSAKPGTNLWPLAMTAVALVGGGAAVWFLKPATPTPMTVAAAVLPAAPAVTETSTRAEPLPAASAPAAAPRPEPTSPQLHIDISSTAPAAPAPAQQSTLELQPVPAAVPVAAGTSAAPAPIQITLQAEDPRVLAFLDSARINGIRVAADDAKLLMNNKVFRAGDIVDRELGLKLITIRPGELVFEDKRTTQYRKPI